MKVIPFHATSQSTPKDRAAPVSAARSGARQAGVARRSLVSHAALAAALLTVAAAPAWAQEPVQPGWYARGSVAAVLGDAQARLSQGNPASGIPSTLYDQTPDFSTRDTAALSLAFGRQFTANWRGELELRYAKSKFDADTLSGSGGRTADSFELNGSVRSTSLLFNGAYDFDAGGGWRPYVKAGLGVTEHRSDANLTATIIALGITTPSPNPFPKGSETSFTWALGAGVGYAIDARTSFDLGYRYLDMGDARTGTDGFSDRVRTEMRAHEISAGISYRF